MQKEEPSLCTAGADFAISSSLFCLRPPPSKGWEDVCSDREAIECRCLCNICKHVLDAFQPGWKWSVSDSLRERLKTTHLYSDIKCTSLYNMCKCCLCNQNNLITKIWRTALKSDILLMLQGKNVLFTYAPDSQQPCLAWLVAEGTDLMFITSKELIPSTWIMQLLCQVLGTKWTV